MSALIEIGEVERGKRLCERLLSYASPLELYAEELDPHTGRHLGNFPQAFTHLALVNAVMHVIRAEENTSAPVVVAPPGLTPPPSGLAMGGAGPGGAGLGGDGHPSDDEPLPAGRADRLG